jgi:hypothetical protein
VCRWASLGPEGHTCCSQALHCMAAIRSSARETEGPVQSSEQQGTAHAVVMLKEDLASCAGVGPGAAAAAAGSHPRGQHRQPDARACKGSTQVRQRRFPAVLLQAAAAVQSMSSQSTACIKARSFWVFAFVCSHCTGCEGIVQTHTRRGAAAMAEFALLRNHGPACPRLQT